MWLCTLSIRNDGAISWTWSKVIEQKYNKHSLWKFVAPHMYCWNGSLSFGHKIIVVFMINTRSSKPNDRNLSSCKGAHSVNEPCYFTISEKEGMQMENILVPAIKWSKCYLKNVNKSSHPIYIVIFAFRVVIMKPIKHYVLYERLYETG